jgi:3-methylcrotonyl-CoA carboxylase beta subunit
MIHGNLVAIVANDATVKGGTYYPITVKVRASVGNIVAESELTVSTATAGLYLPKPYGILCNLQRIDS